MKSDSDRGAREVSDPALASTLVSSADAISQFPSTVDTPSVTPATDASSPGPPNASIRSLPVGTLFGNFEVIRKIAQGGMGVVYEAKHRTIGRRAAIKVMHPECAAKPGYAERFLNEARAVNIIQHPGLVEIFEYGQQPDGTLFIVMEYLRGESLEQRLESLGHPLPESQAIDITLQLARTLTTAHEKGVVHRDLKPDTAASEDSAA